MMKFLVIVFVIKLFTQNSLIKRNYRYFSSYVSITLHENHLLLEASGLATEVNGGIK